MCKMYEVSLLKIKKMMLANHRVNEVAMNEDLAYHEKSEKSSVNDR